MGGRDFSATRASREGLLAAKQVGRPPAMANKRALAVALVAKACLVVEELRVDVVEAWASCCQAAAKAAALALALAAVVVVWALAAIERPVEGRGVVLQERALR